MKRSILKNILISDCVVESDKGKISIDNYIEYINNVIKPQKMWINDDLYNEKVHDKDFDVDFMQNLNMIKRKGGHMDDRKITLDFAREQVEKCKEKILIHENSYEYYDLSGKAKEDEHNLEFWKNKVKELEDEERKSHKADN
jgi:hypothetical protein